MKIYLHCIFQCIMRHLGMFRRKHILVMHTPLFCYYTYIHVYTYLNMLSYINAVFQFSVFSRFVKYFVLSLSIKIVLTLFVSYGSSAVTRHRSWKITSKKIRTRLPNPFDTLYFYDLVTQKSSASVEMVFIQFVRLLVLIDHIFTETWTLSQCQICRYPWLRLFSWWKDINQEMDI